MSEPLAPDPVAAGVAAFVSLLAAITPKLFELFSHQGRDGVIVSIDAMLATARAKTDEDLRRKHGT